MQHPRNAKWLYTKCIWLCADACQHIHLMCFVVQIINTHRWQYWNMYSVLPELASSVLIVNWLRYSSYWKLSLQNHSYLRKALGSRKSETITFLRRVKWRDAMDHNKIDTLLVVWAVTSEQMKIKSQFFLLGSCCHSLMRCETQSTVKKKVIIEFAMHTIFAHLSKICLLKNCLSGCNDG